MAKYTVECPTCNTPYTVQLFGKNRDRDWKLENFDWTCDDCKAKVRQEQGAAAAVENAAAGMAPLIGTEKQIAWAETIRKQKFTTLNESILRADPGRINDARLQAALTNLKNRIDAHWWIDHRDERIELLLKKEYDQTDTPLPLEEQKTATQAKMEATAEATVRPETPITETVAEIRINDRVIEVYFPEKREDFWSLIKKELRFEWSGLCWRRAISPVTGGTPQDRAAETGHRLLAAGFPIRIFAAELRTKAVNGTYEPECRRWVKKRTAGEFIGWFAISWPYGEDFYQAAKKLPGSRYRKPDVVVPAEQFEQVQDFAEMYGFQMSVGARELAETAKQIKEAALTARVVERDNALPPEPGRKPRKLPVPENVPVAEEFKEEVRP
jgi:hypothetical protein